MALAQSYLYHGGCKMSIFQLQPSLHVYQLVLHQELCLLHLFMYLCVKGQNIRIPVFSNALGIETRGREEEEANWVEGEVEQQCSPNRSLSNPTDLSQIAVSGPSLCIPKLDQSLGTGCLWKLKPWAR